MTTSQMHTPTSRLFTPADCRTGMRPTETWEIRTSRDLQALPARLQAWQLQHPDGEACGVLSYDAGRHINALSPACTTRLPLACVHLYTADQVHHHAGGIPDDTAPGPFRLTSSFVPQQSDHEYLEAIHRIQAYEASGDCYQVNYARQFNAKAEGHPFSAYIHLVRNHPAPWSSYIECAGGAVFGVSPECFVRISGKTITAEPIKGSRPRGENPKADSAIARELTGSGKDRAENLMIVDLLRNDLGRVSLPGSVSAPSLFELKQFSNVQHLVSTVNATLKKDILPLQALLMCMPGGSITGAPKKRAMEIIEELEPFNRGYYCGSQFWLNANGDIDANILIRTFQWFDGNVSCHGGGGIVVDSEPVAELNESNFKVKALMETLWSPST